MKTINELLTTKTSLEDRISELLEICPNLLEGKEVCYDKDFYIRYDSNSGILYAGITGKKHETLINMAFPCIFYLYGIYLAKELAEKYDANEKMKNDKNLSIDENGFLVLKGYGVAGNEYIYRSIIEEHQEDEEIINDVLDTIEKNIA